MKKFSELTTEERYKLGNDFGDRLLGTAEYPEHVIDAFMEAREIEQDAEPLMERNFCNGLDDRAMMCDDCNWYVPPDEIGDFGNCSDCQGYEDYDDGYGEEDAGDK